MWGVKKIFEIKHDVEKCKKIVESIYGKCRWKGKILQYNNRDRLFAI